MGATTGFARRIIEKYHLSPPIDIETLVANYAEVIYRAIPVSGVDGLSLHLKMPGKRPTVVINTTNPPRRKRFTLAHELGHILIPWHMGSFVDSLDLGEAGDSEDYWTFEKEANEFAAEVLMPEAWVANLVKCEANLAMCHKIIVQTCDVSPHAASIQLTKSLPSHIAYAVVRDSKVEHSGRTEGTRAASLLRSQPLPSEPFSYARQYFVEHLEHQSLHWWVLPDRVSLNSSDSRQWREILNGIVEDIGVPEEKRNHFKSSVNGVIAAANGSIRNQPGYSIDMVAAACLHRLYNREQYEAFVQHQDFETFIAKKASSFVHGDA
ncbi:ImmA/IrrE family metallo-endopeptidase [Candidatus Contendibacter odensensis]|uniref:IrrE N-terminal-like domain-containing protein n=1 Tax=Candidatus Contendobacter odensis Run_B_J11 TaxID=1400861 RepID=A0A7U7J4S5_9GAMM|nr:ImmA/IrrE family metallo-endopeptidase [Candidatus Contendobacter odensis]CDH45546.1 hypothetical protein BN874_2540005 [Candidatus Contendobacter odensis Run_B_J11]